MINNYVITAGSVSGYRNIENDINKKETYLIMKFKRPESSLNFIISGNQKRENSDVGVKLAKEILKKICGISMGFMDMKNKNIDQEIECFLDSLNSSIYNKLNKEDFINFIDNKEDFLDFSLLGFFIIRDLVYIFSRGEGVYGYKKSNTEDEFQLEYLEYQNKENKTFLASTEDTEDNKKIEINDKLSLFEIKQLFIASNGLKDYLKLKPNIIIPRTTYRIKPIEKLCDIEYNREEDTYFNIGDYLIKMNLGKSMTSKNRMLKNDTTMIILNTLHK